MPTYLVRKRFGWFKRVRVTVQEVDTPRGDGHERWRASFRFIWDADTFIDGLCRNSPYYRAVDSDYSAPIGLQIGGEIDMTKLTAKAVPYSSVVGGSIAVH